MVSISQCQNKVGKGQVRWVPSSQPFTSNKLYIYRKKLSTWNLLCETASNRSDLQFTGTLLVFAIVGSEPLLLLTCLFLKGYYTCVEVIFTLRRQVGFYMMGVYAPTLLIVVLSWLSFWINPDASAARVPLGKVFCASLSCWECVMSLHS